MEGALFLIRILFVIITASTCYQISTALFTTYPFAFQNLASLVLGVIMAIAIIFVEVKYALRFIITVFSFILGLLIGFIAANLFIRAIYLIPHIRFLHENFPTFTKVEDSLQVLITFFFCYMSIAVLIRTRDRFKVLIPFVDFTQTHSEQYLIVDTCIIIDGRILSLCESNIIQGTLVIPKFVLDEMQKLADSADKTKRSRGRRGLEILTALQKNKKIRIHLNQETFPRIKEVDTKLIALSEKLQGTLVSNDYNLKKIAELHKINVININEIANSLRPPVLPGNTFSIRIIKEGEEKRQGIGYLDDGTVVIVEEGASAIGRSVEILVTNVLQTSVGRMVFGKIFNEK